MHKLVKLCVEMKEECFSFVITLRRTLEKDDFWCRKNFLAANFCEFEREKERVEWCMWWSVRESKERKIKCGGEVND